MWSGSSPLLCWWHPSKTQFSFFFHPHILQWESTRSWPSAHIICHQLPWVVRSSRRASWCCSGKRTFWNRFLVQLVWQVACDRPGKSFGAWVNLGCGSHGWLSSKNLPIKTGDFLMRKLLEYQTVAPSQRFNHLQGLQDCPGKNNIASRFKELSEMIMQDFLRKTKKVCSWHWKPTWMEYPRFLTAINPHVGCFTPHLVLKCQESEATVFTLWRSAGTPRKCWKALYSYFSWLKNDSISWIFMDLHGKIPWLPSGNLT